MSTQSPTYLCYDLKGIQSFIFAVPKLKYICGGSALVDRFDKESANLSALPQGCAHLFSGGGKGAFACTSTEAADMIQNQLIERAHHDGMNICFGRDLDYSTAANRATRSFPWMPEEAELSGQPCKVSGLFPVSDGGTHYKISQRVWQRGGRLDRHYETELLQGLHLKSYNGTQLEFFHEIGTESPDARLASEAMGNRNRWAVIAMDGNDMGQQHRCATDLYSGNSVEYQSWLKEMSQKLDACTRKSCKQGIQEVVRTWEIEADEDCEGILPFRPLVVGGDDVIVLCHVRYAQLFVEKVSSSFTEISQAFNQSWKQQHGKDLWLGTKGQLTISAGILYAPVNLPLSTAIAYAESLLKSAKGLGREHATDGEASPSCVDWESVTEGVIDTPAARRQRELRFKDPDMENTVIELTSRPYTLAAMKEVQKQTEEFKKVPPTIRHQVLPAMRQPFWERRLFVERLMKHQKKLAQQLLEGDEPANPVRSAWIDEEKSGIRIRKLPLLDALFLLEEENRMDWETIQGEKA